MGPIKRNPGNITIRGEMYSLEIDGELEIGDLQTAIERNRTAVLEAFVVAGVPRSRIAGALDDRQSEQREPDPGDVDAVFLKALRQGDLDSVRACLAAGADVEARLSQGYRPLMIAARRGRTEVVRELLDRGADASKIHKNHANKSGARGGATALSMAIERDHCEVASLLLEHVGPAKKGKAAITVLLAAAGARTARYLELLANYGYKPTWRGDSGQTAVHVAAANGPAGSIQLLVDAGGDPNARDTTDRATPLHWAVAKGKTANVRALLRAGADPSLRDKSGFDALGIACACDAPEALVAVLRRAQES